jgi:cytochrome c biogenesis protein CcmG/thiol:disulfide interchange protein DsbE
MKRMFLFLPLLAALVLGIILFAGIGKDTESLESALVGKPVPAFKLTDLQDPTKSLGPDLFQGKIRLLNVWATWCPSCRDEHQDLMWLAHNKGVPIIGLNYKDDRAEALTWLKRLGNPYQTVIHDPKGTLGFDMGVYGAPETFVIDAKGTVRFRHVGVVNERVWEEELLPVINDVKENG